MINFALEFKITGGTLLGISDDYDEKLIPVDKLVSSDDTDQYQLVLAAISKFNKKVHKGSFKDVKEVEIIKGEDNDKEITFAPKIRSFNLVENAIIMYLTCTVYFGRNAIPGNPDCSYEKIRKFAEFYMIMYMNQFAKFNDRKIHRIDKCAAEVKYTNASETGAVESSGDTYFFGDSTLNATPRIINREVRSDGCMGFFTISPNKERPLGATPFDMVMKKFDNELKIIKNTKHDIFMGVPAVYIIPSTYCGRFAGRLINALFESKLCFSKQYVVYNSLDSDRNSRCAWGIAELEEILLGTSIVLDLKYDFSNDSNMRMSDGITTTKLKQFLSTYYTRSLSINGAIIFTTDNKEEEAIIKACLASSGYFCRDLLPDAITSLLTCKKFLNKQAREQGFKKGFTGKLDQGVYTYMELMNIYDTWKASKLYTDVYGRADKLQVKAVAGYSPETKLDKMIGLTNVKKVVGEIISQFKMQALLKDRGVSKGTPCRHMCFYGNPGTAKTTVARLIGEILKKNGILLNGKFVEVGRSDLVSGYVGQTAPKTKEKIMEAKGGILFIDEAYSLVEKKGLYGDEAINTLVEMMDNVREDTIIIFAGYPKKMEEFLDKNEGLRSRIAFHITFDNYTVPELIKILKVMAKEEHYHLTDEAIEIAKDKISEAMGAKDFGNGRFVRNLLERTIMKQSVRIINRKDNSYKKMPTEELTALSEVDIESVEMSVGEEHKEMGFRL